MNLVELNVVASPIGGLVGGISAAKGASLLGKIVAAFAGVGIGLVLYVGLFWVALFINANLQRNSTKEGSAKNGNPIVGTLFFLGMMALPILAGGMSYGIVSLFR